MAEKDLRIVLIEKNRPSVYFMHYNYAFEKLGPTKIADGKNSGIKKFYKYLNKQTGLSVDNLKNMFRTYKNWLLGEYCYDVFTQSTERVIRLIIDYIKANDDIRGELIARIGVPVKYIDFLFYNQMLALDYTAKYDKNETVRDAAFDLHNRLADITDMLQ